MLRKIQARYRQFKIAFFVSLEILVLIPFVFTFYQMGFFRGEPKIHEQTNVKEDAPVLRVVADYDFCPRSFYDSQNRKSGLDVELIYQIADRLGYKVDIDFYDWPNCKKALQDGNADLILGLEIFSNMSGVNKTIPISYDQLNIYGKKKISEAASLSGKKVGIIINSVIKNLFDLNCEYIEYYTNTAILKAVESGEVDFGICHGAVSAKIIERENLSIKTCFPLMESYPAIGIRLGREDLLLKINAVIQQMSDSGELLKLEQKWIDHFSPNPSFMTVFLKFEYIYILYFIISLIYVFLMILILMALNSQIKMKKHFDILSSVADIYYSMHYIDLKNDSVEVALSASDDVNNIIKQEKDASKKMALVMTKNVIAGDVERALSFTDLSTVAKRLQNKKTIFADFMGKNIGWFRAQFVAVNRDENNEVQSVVFTTQVIDDEKKREQELIYLSSIDELTRLFNRRAYEVDAAIENKKIAKDFVYISLDLNGLKKLNDSKGHAAGDELLQGAADCLSMVFNPYGKVYRMGGDEFAVMIHINDEDLADSMDSLEKILSGWNGNFVKGISISSGVVCAKDYPEKSLEEMAVVADDLMYAAKKEYYKRTGQTREA